MNIRERWVGIKDSIGLEAHRLYQMLCEEASGRSDRTGAYIVAGQEVTIKDILADLAIPFLVEHGGDFAVAKPSRYGYGSSYWLMVSASSDVEFFRKCAVESHCPLTLKEADALLIAMTALTPEHIHHALDAALLATS